MNPISDTSIYEQVFDFLMQTQNPEPGILPVEINLPINGAVVRLGKKAVAFIDPQESSIPLFYVPVCHYRGVTMTLLGTYADKGTRILVDLHHDDSRLSVPLSICSDLEEGQNHWEEWGRALHLPLIVRTLCDDDLLDSEEGTNKALMRDILPEHKRPRAMILVSQKSCRQDSIPSIQYDGWDLVAWR